MNCIPCVFCDKNGARYSYGIEKNYVLEEFPEFKQGLERIIDPVINFRLFSGLRTSIN